MTVYMVPAQRSHRLRSRPALSALALSALALSAFMGPTSAHAQGNPGGDSPPDANGSAPAASPPDQADQAPQAPDPPPPQPDERPWAQGVSEAAQARANELFEAGDALLREFQLTAALASYQKALGHWKHPAIHYRVASILVSQGRQVKAYAETEQALRYGEAPLGKQFFDNATRIKKELEDTLVWLTVTCREVGAEVRLDGELLFNGPGTTERILAPGPHTVVATKAGMIPGTKSVSLASGSRTTVELSLRAEAAREEYYPTRGRFGGTVQAIFDPQGLDLAARQGVAAMVGASFGVLDNIDIEFGAILSGNPGLYASSVFYLRKGLWRPTVFLSVPVLWAGSLQPGARAGLGLEYTPTPWLAITAQAGLDYYPRATQQFVSTLFAPSIGIKMRR